MKPASTNAQIQKLTNLYAQTYTRAQPWPCDGVRLTWLLHPGAGVGWRVKSGVAGSSAGFLHMAKSEVGDRADHNVGEFVVTGVGDSVVGD